MGEVSLGTLYDMNKALMKNEKALKPFEIKDEIRKIASFYNKNGNTTYHYYMLLCREQYDFTLFSNAAHGAMLQQSSFIQDLYECLTNRGEVLSIEQVIDNEAFEIWLRFPDMEEDNNLFVYYFFPYDNGVINIKEK